MKARKFKKNIIVKMVMAAMVVMFVLSSIPAGAFELALATGDAYTKGYAKHSDGAIAKDVKIAASDQRLSAKALRDLIEIPQP